MATVLIVAPVFALIAAGYAAVLFRFVSESAHKGISEFAFSIAIPALLFRTIVVSEFPDVSPYRMWGAYYGALALTWLAALALSALLRARREDREDGVVFAIGSVYGNIVMLGIPLTLSALGNEAAGPMALILSVNTPLLWLCGILQMELVSRKQAGSPLAVIRPVLADLARNPLMLGIGFGVVWRFTGLGLNPVVDRTIELLAQAGSPAALIALGINLFVSRSRARSSALPSCPRSSCWRCRRPPSCSPSCCICRRSRPASSCCSRQCRPAPTRTSSRFSTSGW